MFFSVLRSLKLGSIETLKLWIMFLAGSVLALKVRESVKVMTNQLVIFQQHFFFFFANNIIIIDIPAGRCNV